MPLYLLSGEYRRSPTAPLTLFCGLPVVAPDAETAQLRAEIMLAPSGKIDTVREIGSVRTSPRPDMSLASDDIRAVAEQLLTGWVD